MQLTVINKQNSILITSPKHCTFCFASCIFLYQNKYLTSQSNYWNFCQMYSLNYMPLYLCIYKIITCVHEYQTTSTWASFRNRLNVFTKPLSCTYLMTEWSRASLSSAFGVSVSCLGCSLSCFFPIVDLGSSFCFCSAMRTWRGFKVRSLEIELVSSTRSIHWYKKNQN